LAKLPKIRRLIAFAPFSRVFRTFYNKLIIDISLLSDTRCHAAKTLRYWNFTSNGR